MADPHIVNGIRAQVVLQDASLLPRDRYITTWAFEATTPAIPTDGELDAVADKLISFFNDSPGPGLDPVARQISSVVSRGVDTSQVKLYRLNDPLPRVPRVRPFQLVAAPTGDNGLPGEVAICLSFKSSFRAGPRGRGRVYLGPVHSSVGFLASGQYQLTGSSRVAIAAAASTLMGAAGPIWSILSQADHAFHRVTSGFVDNEFDTQRSRGKRATARLVWP